MREKNLETEKLYVVNIEKIKKMVKRMPENGIKCIVYQAQKIDGTVCMINQIRNPHVCVGAGCKHFKCGN